jgi:hypothetical protein
MGLLDFFRTPKPYCIEVTKKSGEIIYISNILGDKGQSFVFKNNIIDMYADCVYGDAVATNTDTGVSTKYYYYYDFCKSKNNAMQFPHIGKMSDSDQTMVKIVFKSVEDAGGKCKFIFHNE